jgi:hypothetical protein
MESVEGWKAGDMGTWWYCSLQIKILKVLKDTGGAK